MRVLLGAAIVLTQAGCVEAVHDCFEGRGCRDMFYTDYTIVCRRPLPADPRLKDGRFEEEMRKNVEAMEAQRRESAAAAARSGELTQGKADNSGSGR